MCVTVGTLFTLGIGSEDIFLLTIFSHWIAEMITWIKYQQNTQHRKKQIHHSDNRWKPSQNERATWFSEHTKGMLHSNSWIDIISVLWPLFHSFFNSILDEWTISVAMMMMMMTSYLCCFPHRLRLFIPKFYPSWNENEK